MNILNFAHLRLEVILLTLLGGSGLFLVEPLSGPNLIPANLKVMPVSTPATAACERDIKFIFSRHNILNSERDDCPFFEHSQGVVQYIFCQPVKHQVEGNDTCRGKINSDFVLSSPSSVTDRITGILHAGGLENNIVNKCQSSREDSL